MILLLKQNHILFEVNNTEVVYYQQFVEILKPHYMVLIFVIISFLVVSVSVEPEPALIPILTIPYLGVSSSSPPHALTDNALG